MPIPCGALGPSDGPNVTKNASTWPRATPQCLIFAIKTSGFFVVFDFPFLASMVPLVVLLGVMLDLFGPSWAHLVAQLGLWGASWGACGGLLGLSGLGLGALLASP